MNRIENIVNCETSGKREDLIELAEDPKTKSILSNVNGVVVDYFEFGNSEAKEVNAQRYSKCGWEILEVGKWTIFHIDKEEYIRTVKECLG